MTNRIAYLSGAPRVSTHMEAEASGPRAHVLGVIHAFEALGWTVKPYIVGDRAPKEWIRQGSGRAVSKDFSRRLAADLIRLVFRVRNSRKAARMLANEVDFVYERFAALQAMGVTFKRRGVPWILETNAPLFYEAKSERKSSTLDWLTHRLEVKAYRDCDVLVCVSQVLKDIVVREAGIDPYKVVVMPNGADVKTFDPSKHETQRLFDGLVVGFVGTLQPWQRLDLLFMALKRLREEGLDVSAVIVGDGVARQDWEDCALTLGLNPFVRFVGRVPWADVPGYINGFDLGYSAPESMKIGMYLSPLKLYEYMAMATPVLAASSEDAKSVIDNDETGFLFDQGDGQALAAALRKAYEVRDALPKIGMRARDVIVRQHSWSTRVQRMMIEAKKILGER